MNSPARVLIHNDQLLVQVAPHRRHQPAPIRELIEKRPGNVRRSDPHHDLVERSLLRPASVPVALAHRDIGVAKVPQNLPGRLRQLCDRAGLEVEELQQFETEPEYLAFSTPAYAVGVAFERLVNRFDALKPLRVNLLLVARKR